MGAEFFVLKGMWYIAENVAVRGELVPNPGMNQGLELSGDDVWNLKWKRTDQPREKLR